MSYSMHISWFESVLLFQCNCWCFAMSDVWICSFLDTRLLLILMAMTSKENSGRILPSAIRSMVQTFPARSMIRTRMSGTQIGWAQFLTWSTQILVSGLKVSTLLIYTLECGKPCSRGTPKIWIYIASTTCTTVHQSHGMQCPRNMVANWKG